MIAPLIVGMIGSAAVTLAGFAHLHIFCRHSPRGALVIWVAGGLMMTGAWIGELMSVVIR